MPESDITNRPKRKASDVAHTLVKAGLSAVPMVGSTANELLSLVISPSLEKRRDKWIESIAEALKVLEEQISGFKIENLCENELFISTVMKALQVAMRNHQKEKLDALNNAVLNSALPNAPEEDMQFMFLNFVDTFTPQHLFLLQFFSKVPNIHNPKKRMELIDKELRKFIPDWTSNKEFFSQVVQELSSSGLVNVGKKEIEGLIISSHPITDLGKKFLEFVTSPIQSKNCNAVQGNRKKRRDNR